MALERASVTKDELRETILSRLERFTDRVDWIGDTADSAFADSIIGLIDTFAEAAALREVARGIREATRG